MDKKFGVPLVWAFAILVLTACNTGNEEKRLFDQIETVRSEYAPDKRTALFNIIITKNTEKYILNGESNLPEAVETLKQKLRAENIQFTDKIKMLPNEELQGKTEAIINISVANLRSEAKHSAELATQATLGTPVKVLKNQEGWFYVQTPDKYLSWVDDGGIQLMDTQQIAQWMNTKKIIYTQTYGKSYTGPDKKQPVSDLVAGNILEILKYTDKFYIVRYPDGREAFVSNEEAEEYDAWLEKLNSNGDSLIATSKTLMGVPYLWGGTSTKGVDCSGFTKTIYFLNGMVIPRDASQQVHAGKSIDSVQNFDNLEKGDLLFFGRKATDSTAEKVVHVGMWIGNNEFIHASNMVRISSIDPNAENFDEWNLNRYLRTKRILKEADDALINLEQTSLFKD